MEQVEPTPGTTYERFTSDSTTPKTRGGDKIALQLPRHVTMIFVARPAGLGSPRCYRITVSSVVSVGLLGPGFYSTV